MLKKATFRILNFPPWAKMTNNDPTSIFSNLYYWPGVVVVSTLASHPGGPSLIP